MNSVEIVSYIQLTALAARALRSIPVDELLQEFERTEVFGVFADPTAWMQSADNRRANQAMFEAAKPLIEWAKANVPAPEDDHG